MSLLDLPNELLLVIAERMLSRTDINAMAQLNRFFHDLLNKFLYTRNIRKSGSSALIWAAKNGQLGTAQHLIKGGANIEIYSRAQMQRPLHIAATYGHLEVAQLLVDHGATINRLDVQYKSPLHYAATYGHAAVVDMLLRHGAQLLDRTNRLMHESPLHQAAKNGHAEVVRRLLEAGGDINATKFDTRETPLHLSLDCLHFQHPHKGKGRRLSLKEVEAKKAETAVLLIEHGADVRTRQKSNKTPLELAVQFSHVEAVRLLLEKGANPHGSVDTPSPYISPSLFDLFSSYAPNIMTIMDLARSRGNEDIIGLLSDAANTAYVATYGAASASRAASGDIMDEYLEFLPGPKKSSGNAKVLNWDKIPEALGFF